MRDGGLFFARGVSFGASCYTYTGPQACGRLIAAPTPLSSLCERELSWPIPREAMTEGSIPPPLRGTSLFEREVR